MDKSTTEAKQPEAKAADGDKKAPAGVPDRYDFKAPEGYEIDPKVIDDATPVLRELGLNNEQAQKLFDIYAKHSAEGESKLIDAYQNLRDDWRKEMVNDKVLGDGKSNLSADTQANIDAGIKALPADLQQPFRDAMNLTGAGDNPAFVRAWNYIGQQFREGTSVRGGNPSPFGQTKPGEGPRSAAQALYPNLKSSAS